MHLTRKVHVFMCPYRLVGDSLLAFTGLSLFWPRARLFLSNYWTPEKHYALYAYDGVEPVVSARMIWWCSGHVFDDVADLIAVGRAPIFPC